MTLEPEDKQALSHVRMAKAVEFLEDARAAHAQRRYRTAVNRAYYAVLSAARAILVLLGDSPTSHEGVVTMLSLRLVKTGELGVDIVKSFKLLAARRVDVDYGDFDTVGEEESAASVGAAEGLVATLQPLQTRLLAELGDAAG